MFTIPNSFAKVNQKLSAQRFICDCDNKPHRSFSKANQKLHVMFKANVICKQVVVPFWRNVYNFNG